jgi:L-alanine-DL-glutamate epimerase-like enolase superfamily enzyme
MAEICGKYNIFFYEEAATPLLPEMHKRVAEKITIPIASGERIYSRWGFAPFFEDGSIQVAQPDIGNCGGLTESKKICDMAHVYDVSVQAHVWASPILAAAALHLETAVPNFLIHEVHRGIVMSPCRALCEIVNEPVNGYISVSELPGLGNELSSFALSRAEKTVVK